MVLWHHALPADIQFIKIDNRGFLGVDLFFVLSGYIITTLLVRERSQHGDISLKNFYMRRAVRILPIYYFVVSAVSIYYIFVKGSFEYSNIIIYYYLFLSNFLVNGIPILGPTWSLSVEEQYYLFWPLIMVLAPARIFIPILILLIFINVAVKTGWFWIPEPLGFGPLLFQMPNSTYAPILMGSLAAIVLENRTAFNRISPLFSHWIASPLIFLLLLFAIEFSPSDLRGAPNFVIHTLMTLFLITLVIVKKNAFFVFLNNPIIVRFGTVSYGIYLYHLFALDIINRILDFIEIESPWLVFFAYSILSYAVAEVSFRTLEAYFRRFRPQNKSG